MLLTNILGQQLLLQKFPFPEVAVTHFAREQADEQLLLLFLCHTTAEFKTCALLAAGQGAGQEHVRKGQVTFPANFLLPRAWSLVIYVSHHIEILVFSRSRWSLSEPQEKPFFINSGQLHKQNWHHAQYPPCGSSLIKPSSLVTWSSSWSKR